MSSSKASKSSFPKIILLLLPLGLIIGSVGVNSFMDRNKNQNSAEVLDTSSSEALVVSLKRPLAEAIEAVGDKNFTRAKRELGEFQEFWEKVEPMYKVKAPSAHQKITQQFTEVKSSLTGSPDQKKVTDAIQQLSQMIEANTSTVLSGQLPKAIAPNPPSKSTTATSISLSSELLVALKRPMAEGIEATNDSNFIRAKREYEEFLELWKKSEESVKQKSSQAFDEVEVGMDSVFAALIEPKTPEKQKVIAAFEQIQTTLNKL